MTARMNIAALAREGYRAVAALESWVAANGDGRLLHLVKLRASMMNGCAYCVDMHSTEALADGEDVRRVVAVAAWRETTFFTAAERAALALTEAVTRLGEHGVPDDVWDDAVAELGEQQVAHLVLAIATINVWNRISVATRTPPPPLAP